MAQYQSQVQSGEVTQRFIEFVMMHSQNVLFCLGQIPDPEGKKMEPNLPMARLFIDQLDAIREKTRGNLNSDEEQMLTQTLTNLRLQYVTVSDKPST